MKGLGGFNIEKASFKTWLTRIADNKVTDYFRSRQYHESIVTQIMDDTIQEPADERAGTETSVLGKLSYEEIITRIRNGKPSGLKCMKVIHLAR